MANVIATNGFEFYGFVYAFQDDGADKEVVLSSSNKMIINVISDIGVVRHEFTGIDLGFTSKSEYWPTSGTITGLKIIHTNSTNIGGNPTLDITGLAINANTNFAQIVKANTADDNFTDEFYDFAYNVFMGGDDIFHVNRGEKVYGGNGNDLFRLSENGPIKKWHVEGGAGMDTLDLSGLHGANMLDNNGKTVSFVAFGIEKIIGSAHNDILLVNPAWNESIQKYVYSQGDYIDGGSGNDEIWGSIASNNLFGSKGNDIIYGSKVNPGIDSSYQAGEAGGDHLDGGSGNDMLYGSGYNDLLFGSQGKDFLYGSAGDDKIDGGSGDDRLTGGRGVDLFVYRSPEDSLTARRDIILDFSRAEGDLIDLSAMDADKGVAGNQSFTYIGTSAFSGEAGELRVSYRSGGFAVVTGDVNGDGVEDFNIRVNGMNLSQPFVDSDFLL